MLGLPAPYYILSNTALQLYSLFADASFPPD
jgi:hypothetical protein